MAGTAANVSADPVSAIANAAGKMFDFGKEALTVLDNQFARAQERTRMWYAQLMGAKPKYRDPFGNLYEAESALNMKILAGLGAVIVVLALVIVFRKK